MRKPANQAAELPQLLATPGCVTLTSGSFSLYALQVQQLPQAMALAGPVLAQLQVLAAALSAERAKGSGLDVLFDEALNGIDAMQLMAQNAGELMALCALVTREPLTMIEPLGLDEFLTLLLAVVEANLDFFFLRLRPALQAGMGRLLQGLDSSPLPSV